MTSPHGPSPLRGWLFALLAAVAGILPVTALYPRSSESYENGQFTQACVIFVPLVTRVVTWTSIAAGLGVGAALFDAPTALSQLLNAALEPHTERQGPGNEVEVLRGAELPATATLDLASGRKGCLRWEREAVYLQFAGPSSASWVLDVVRRAQQQRCIDVVLHPSELLSP